MLSLKRECPYTRESQVAPGENTESPFEISKRKSDPVLVKKNNTIKILLKIHTNTHTHVT